MIIPIRGRVASKIEVIRHSMSDDLRAIIAEDGNVRNVADRQHRYEATLHQRGPDNITQAGPRTIRRGLICAFDLACFWCAYKSVIHQSVVSKEHPFGIEPIQTVSPRTSPARLALQSFATRPIVISTCRYMPCL